MALELSLNGDKTVALLQRGFSEVFSHLTIRVFDQEGRPVDAGTTLSEVRTKKGQVISIKSTRTVGSIERNFLDALGIRVEVVWSRDGEYFHDRQDAEKTLGGLNEWCVENGCDLQHSSAGASGVAPKDIRITWVTNRTPLTTAVADRGDVEEVRRILASGESEIDAVDSAEGYTATHYASWDGREEILSLLLAHGAAVDPVGKDGRTPLHLASANGRTGCVRILLDHGAEVDRRIRDSNKFHSEAGGTALRDALINQFWDVYDLLVSRGGDVQVLAEPCIDGSDFLDAVEGVAGQYPEVGARFDAGRLQAIREQLQPGRTRKPEKKQASQADGYLRRWRVQTERHGDSLLQVRLPSWVDKLSLACPDLTEAEGAAIEQAVIGRKLIPMLDFAPEPFFQHTKRVWWILPLVVWKDEVMSWLMMDKNGFYAPHPGREDICFIAPYDRITEYDLEQDEQGLDRLTLHYDNGNFLTIDGFVPDGGASYMRIAYAIMKVRQPTIDASRGEPTWKEGAGGEGFLEFTEASQLKALDHWRNGEVSRPDPKFFA